MYKVIEVSNKVVRISLRNRILTIDKAKIEEIVGRVVTTINDCENALLDITGEA